MATQTLAIRVSEPAYYHREYTNDIGEQSKEHTWLDTCKRAGTIALPFFSLYRPLSLPISLTMGGFRTWNCFAQLVDRIKAGDISGIAYGLLQTIIAIASLAGTIFAHPLGMFISTGHDIIIDVAQLVQNLYQAELIKVLENWLSIANNVLYLVLFLDGGLEIAVASFAAQILVGISHSLREFINGNWQEGAGHLLMGGIRGYQLVGQVKMMQMRWEIKRLVQPRQEPGAKMNQNKVSFKSFSSNPKVANGNLQDSDEIALLILKYGGANGHPAIFHAAEHNDLDAVKKLLTFGGDPSYALYGAIRGKSMPILKYLIEDYNVPFSNSEWFTYWYSTEWWEGFDYIISKGEKMPALDYCLNYSLNVIKGLVERGAKFSPGYKIGWYYEISIFAKNFDPELRRKIFEILTKESNLPVDESFKVVHQFGKQYSLCTPLTFAVQNNDIALAETILNLGADPNLTPWDFSPLKLATMKQNQAMMALLISHGAKVGKV